MTKLQKRNRPSQPYLPLTLQVGVRPDGTENLSPPISEAMIPGPKYESTIAGRPQASPSRIFATQQMSGPSLSPCQNTHRRASTSDSLPQWPLKDVQKLPQAIPLTPPRSMPVIPRKALSQAIPLTVTDSIPLALPQAHIRAVSESAIPRVVRPSPPRISTETTTSYQNTLKKCSACGKYKRPVSMPVQFSSGPSRLAIAPKNHQGSSGVRRASLDLRINGTRASRSPSPPTPDYSNNPFASPNDPIVSPLSPRKRVEFLFLNKTPLGASAQSSISNTNAQSPSRPGPSDPEVGTGRLINLLSTAIRESSTHASKPPSLTTSRGKYARGLDPSTPGLGISLPEDIPPVAHEPPRPTSLVPPYELDSTPLHDATATVLMHMQMEDDDHRPHIPARYASFSAHDDEKALDLGSTSTATNTQVHALPSLLADIPSPTLHLPLSTEPEPEPDMELSAVAYAENSTHDWTDTILPSLSGSFSRFRSLRRGETSRFGSMRGKREMQGAWHGGRNGSTRRHGSKYALGGQRGYQALNEVDAC